MKALSHRTLDEQLLGAVRWLCAELSCDALAQIADDGPQSGAPSDLRRGFADGLSCKRILNTRKE
jgi:hypothetical protein